MNLQGKTIVVTGASSGIGEAAVKQLALAGARVCLVARRAEELARVQREITALGGECWIYPADLSDAKSTDACVAALLQEHARIDVLVNNAARSIRRPLLESLERLHDFERTAQLNYLGAVRITLGLLPRFIAQRAGQVVFSSTASTQVPIPLFAAYLASKSALESFARSLSAELHGKGIVVSTLHFPMVRTPMSSRTKIYDRMPMLTVDAAAGWVVEAIIKQPTRIARPWFVLGGVALAALPGPVTRWSQIGFRWMDRSLTKRAGKP